MPEVPGDDEFASVVAGDLAARRAALDALDEATLVADRASILTLHSDGRVDACVVLAGPDGSTNHPRTLTDAAVDRLAAHPPQRWSSPTWVRSATPAPAEPAARLLASWAPTDTIEHQEAVPWASLLVTTDAPR